MKFLSDLGSCYRPSGQARQRQLEEPDKSVQVVLVSGCDETWSTPRRKKMSVSKYWRPELSVISEDSVVSFLEIDQGKANHQYAKKVSSKSKTRSTAKPPPRNCYYKDDQYEYCPRKKSMLMMIPAFSPTPFMF